MKHIVKECGPGWDRLVDPLIERCRAEGVEILQIKEKFGSLRFYVGEASEELHDAVSQAEFDSQRICEQCGEPGICRSDRGWLRTLCDSCELNRRNKKLV